MTNAEMLQKSIETSLSLIKYECLCKPIDSEILNVLNEVLNIEIDLMTKVLQNTKLSSGETAQLEGMRNAYCEIHGIPKEAV